MTKITSYLQSLICHRELTIVIQQNTNPVPDVLDVPDVSKSGGVEICNFVALLFLWNLNIEKNPIILLLTFLLHPTFNFFIFFQRPYFGVIWLWYIGKRTEAVPKGEYITVQWSMTQSFYRLTQNRDSKFVPWAASSCLLM